ncbi:MAG: hypothetical protein Q7U10_12010 [Thermodesulfovibrionia bacterium]|nr:hypothetical protein [Thermodesulfovibrionia bacterium]
MRLMLLLLLIVSLFLFGCAKFKEGECIQDTSKGTILRITAVHYTDYTVQAWFEGKWGVPVKVPFGAYDSGHVKVTCPFSEKTLQ